MGLEDLLVGLSSAEFFQDELNGDSRAVDDGLAGPRTAQVVALTLLYLRLRDRQTYIGYCEIGSPTLWT